MSEANPQVARIFTPAFLRVTLAGFLVFAAFYGLMAVLPLFMLAHHMTVAAVGLSGAGFTLVAVASRLAVGAYLDRQGRKRWYLWGLALIAAVFLAYPAATRLALVLVLRVAHGVGWGWASTAAGALVQDVVPPARRGEATGWYSNATDIAMALGSFLAVAAYSWMGFTPLMLTAAVAMAAAGLAIRPVADPVRPAAHRPSRPSGAKAPAAVQLCANLTFGTIMTFLPVWAASRGLTRPLFLGVDGYALFYLVYVATLLVVRRPAGRLADRRGRALAVIPGLALMALAAGWLAFAHTAWQLAVFAVLFGTGFGSAQPALFALAVERVPPAARGSATGVYYAAFDLGIGISALAGGPAVAHFGWTAVLLAASAASVLALGVFVAGGRPTRAGVQRV